MARARLSNLHPGRRDRSHRGALNCQTRALRNRARRAWGRSGAELAGVLIALDRQEKGKGELSAIQEVQRDYNAPVIAIITLGDLISYLETQPEMAMYLEKVKEYRASYGV